jgi:hypothetical protein
VVFIFELPPSNQAHSLESIVTLFCQTREFLEKFTINNREIETGLTLHPGF